MELGGMNGHGYVWGKSGYGFINLTGQDMHTLAGDSGDVMNGKKNKTKTYHINFKTMGELWASYLYVLKNNFKYSKFNLEKLSDKKNVEGFH